MTALAMSAPPRRRLDFDDEPTPGPANLGGLIRGRSVVVTEDTPLDEVRRLLVELRVPAVAVVDAEDNLRGLVTRTDVLRVFQPDARAIDAMSGFVFALPATAPIEKAAALMAYEGVGQIVVTSARGTLLGMVSAIDIVRYFAAVMRELPR
jgi:CBS domain-containing protein